MDVESEETAEIAHAAYNEDGRLGVCHVVVGAVRLLAVVKSALWWLQCARRLQEALSKQTRVAEQVAGMPTTETKCFGPTCSFWKLGTIGNGAERADNGTRVGSKCRGYFGEEKLSENLVQSQKRSGLFLVSHVAETSNTAKVSVYATNQCRELAGLTGLGLPEG